MSKIYCHNVRVWTRDRDKNSDWYWKLRMERISDVISQIDPDILCLQELSFPANLYISKGYRRVCPSISHPIYVRKGIETRKHRFHLRWDECEVKINEKWMLIINVHLHWDDKIFDRNMKKILKRIKKAYADDLTFVACGDWNTTRDRVVSGLKHMAYVYPWDSYTFKNSTTGHEAKIDLFALGIRDPGRTELICTDGILSDHRPILLTQ